MTRPILIGMLFVGLGLVFFAVKTIQSEFQRYETLVSDLQDKVVETEEIFVVTRRLEYGDVLSSRDISSIQWPSEILPAGAFRNRDDIFPEDGGDRTVLGTIERHELLLPSKVTEPGEPAGMAARLSPGMRAFTLDVNATSGVFIRPGDRVDIYWTGRGQSGSITRLIESSIKLIAVDQQTDQNTGRINPASNVTVEVTPEVVAKLTQARSTGQITLSLVGQGDHNVSGPVMADGNDVSGYVAPTIQAKPEERICTVRQRMGTQVQLVEIPCTNG